MENGNGCVMAESDPYAASAASPVASTTAEKPSHSSEAALNLDQKPDEIAEGAPKLPNSDDHPTFEEPAVSGTAADSTIDAPLLEASEAPMGLASMPSSSKKSPMGTGTADDPISIDDDVSAFTSEELQRQAELSDQQMRRIEEEQKQCALVGDKLPFEILIMQYDENGSSAYHSKAMELASTYSDIRMIRRDGNCFYRSLLVAQLEIIYTDPEEMARFESVCIGWHERLIKLGFPGWTTEDFCQSFYDFIRSIKNKEKTLQQIMEDMNDDHFANYMLIFVRMMASGYIKEHADDYKDFIAGYDSVAEFCASEIEGMWKDADHIAVTGLVHAIGVPIRVEYMDRGAAPDGGTHYDFPQEEDADPEALPKITLLYRPGHYDLIYRK